ncbi:squalene synthase HpnC [Novipirellula artificiosorum]|uniref:All-trans-phytoene synthase n=1 Tax=Novipirellula artificiosorum TaxID=2528016 RepID=A0A5C6E4B3_9BACT|nr:squalene synthase HpnC [Novipirellula artificiosorum]TWU42059.1 All-trans-phytoene synthase [Novipirellula artificiosorum]
MLTADPISESERRCRQIARSNRENFLVASVLLPRWLRQPFYNVYAFCRTADDLADQSPSVLAAAAELTAFQSALDATFAGNPPAGIFPALGDTIRRFDLPKKPFDDLLSAFQQDQSKTRYANSEELLDYCNRSANPVGRIVLRLAGCDQEDADDRRDEADQICRGLQLANFCQDVGRDFAIGRVYLPEDQMARFGVAEADLAASTTSPALRRLLESECARAAACFDSGEALVDHVPTWFARNLRLFIGGGRETLAAIEKAEFDVLRKRPTVSPWTQLRLVMRAIWS